jgi:hypothetical protein
LSKGKSNVHYYNLSSFVAAIERDPKSFAKNSKNQKTGFESVLSLKRTLAADYLHKREVSILGLTPFEETIKETESQENSFSGRNS